MMFSSMALFCLSLYHIYVLLVRGTSLIQEARDFAGGKRLFSINLLNAHAISFSSSAFHLPQVFF